MKEINSAVNSAFLTITLIITPIINSKYLITNYHHIKNLKNNLSPTNINDPLQQNNLVQVKSKSQIIKKHSEILLGISIVILLFLIIVVSYYYSPKK